MTEPGLQFDTYTNLTAKILDVTERGLLLTFDASYPGQLCLHIQTKANDPAHVAHTRQFLNVSELMQLSELTRQRRLLQVIDDLDRALVHVELR